MTSTQLILGLAIVWIAYRFWVPLAVFIHEWGHALTALALGAHNIQVQWGQPAEKSKGIALGPIQFRWGMRGLRYGFCHYHSEGLSPPKIALILLAGPLSNLLILLLLAIIVFGIPLDYVIQMILLAALIAHFRLALFNLIPLTVRDATGTRQHNDGKQLLQLWQQHKTNDPT